MDCVDIPHSSYHQPQSPTSLLCDDVLCHIFLLGAEKSYEAFVATVSASQVCRWWRDLSLSYPELWRRYAFLDWVDGEGYGPWTTEVLKRSQDCGLDVGWRRRRVLVESREPPMVKVPVCGSVSLWIAQQMKGLNPGHRHSNEELQAELGHIGKMRSLFLPLFGGCTQWNATGCFFGVRGSAAKLEELELMAWANSQRGLRVLPSNFLEVDEATGEGASLKKLVMKHCWIDFDFSTGCIRLDGLHTLEIVSTAYLDLMPSKPGSKWGDYIKVLQHCSALRVLKLQFCRLADDDEDNEDRGFIIRKREPVIRIATLQQINIQSRLKEIRRIMETVWVPPGCGMEVQVVGMSAPWSSADVQSVWDVVADKVSRRPDVCFPVGLNSFPVMSLPRED